MIADDHGDCLGSYREQLTEAQAENARLQRALDEAVARAELAEESGTQLRHQKDMLSRELREARDDALWLRDNIQRLRAEAQKQGVKL